MEIKSGEVDVLVGVVTGCTRDEIMKAFGGYNNASINEKLFKKLFCDGAEAFKKGKDYWRDCPYEGGLKKSYWQMGYDGQKNHR